MSYVHRQSSNLQTKRLERAEPQNLLPNCPYTHSKCIRYNPLKQRGICQNHANSNAKSVRCTALPFFVSDGWHVAVLKGGRLHV
jgi:hypothetical protein